GAVLQVRRPILNGRTKRLTPLAERAVDGDFSQRAGDQSPHSGGEWHGRVIGPGGCAEHADSHECHPRRTSPSAHRQAPFANRLDLENRASTWLDAKERGFATQ